MSEQRRVEFFKLSRPIQDRFVGSAGNVFAPVPILFQHVTPKQPLVWAGVSLGSLLALVIVTRVGYGNLDSGLSAHGFVAAIIYVLLIAVCVACAVRAVFSRKRSSALPYRPGIYVFPMCVVDARSEMFEIVQMTNFAGAAMATTPPTRVVLSFSGGEKYEIPVADAAAGQAAIASLEAARDESMAAIARNDPGEIVTLDPLHQPRFSSPVAPRDAYDAYAPKWGRFFFGVGLAVGIVIGPILFFVRNSGSDAKMYRTAVAAGDVASFKEYLAHGKAHKDDVTDTLLPRAELREAEKPGTVEALLQYIADHPDSKIKPEVDDSLRFALLASLEQAKKVGTLAALTDFAAKYAAQRPLISKELAASMHDVYTRELASYKAHAPTKDKTVVPFIERLFAYAEAHGPNVEIKARRKPATIMDKADKFVEKQPAFMGQVSYPTRYFDTAHSQKREAAFEKEVADRMSQAFSPELITFKTAGEGPDPSQPTPQFTVPTILFTHLDDWSTLTYESKVPRGAFIGMMYRFEIEFWIPGDPKPFRYKQDISKGAALNVLDKADVPGVAEDHLYEAMSKDAFGAFEDKFLSLILPPPDKKSP